MEEKEIKDVCPLLGPDGRITVEGWARKPFWRYERKKIKGGAFKIKEWDYYQMTDPEDGCSVCFTISDLGYLALFSLSYIDLKRKAFSQINRMKPFSRHRTGLLSNPDADDGTTYYDEQLTITFVKKDTKRQIIANAPGMVLPDGRKGLKADLVMHQRKDHESINIATSWKEDRTCFYYNEKLSAMPVSGKLYREDDITDLSGRRVLGLLDWGRGKWMRSSTWYWSSFSSFDNDIPWAVSLGYGFTDRSPASENGITYAGTIHKLGKVTFSIPENFGKDSWVLEDEKGRLKVEMTPLVDRKDHTDAKIIKSFQDQVFGLFSGHFILDDGKRISFSSVYGFVEIVKNRW